MTTFSQRDYQALLVGKAFTSTPATTIGALANGEIGIFTPAGVKLTETAAGTTDRFILAVGRGTGVAPLITPVIDKTKVTAKNLKNVVSAAEQLDYIGYNGSTGSIEVNNNSVYRAAINLKDVLAEGNHGGVYIKDMVYKSSAAATQAEIASGLVKSAIANFSREASNVIKFELLCNDAGSAVGAAADTVVGAVGSKYITVTDVGSNTTVNAIAVGDYFRAGTAVTSPVYKVVASTVTTAGGVLTLDVPLQAAVNLVGNTSEFITGALAAVANFGIKMTGIEQPFTVGKIHYKKVRWNVTLSTDSFGATTLTNSTSASEGVGQYEQIASLEWFINGNNGEFFRMGEPNIFGYTSMASDITYRTITIEFQDGRTDSMGYVNTPKVVTLAIPSATVPDYAVTGTADDITDVLEVLLYGATTGNPFGMA